MPSAPTAHEPTALFDPDALIAEVQQLATSVEGEKRTAVAQRLKAVLAESSAKAEALLLKERQGGRCAARLTRMQDDLIRVIYTFAVTLLYPSQSPSESERMAIVATGGYGPGLMAPGSDIDLLFLLPYTQTPWGEQTAEVPLYCQSYMGLTVLHPTRSSRDWIRFAQSDITI